MNRLKPSAAVSSHRSIPSVDRLVRELGENDIPRPVVVELVRHELALMRAEPDDRDQNDRSSQAMTRIRAKLHDLKASKIQPIINATGIVIHTNFGRSPLGERIVQTLGAVASNYTNLEYDLNAGERGQRGNYLENNLALLCQAPAATVVNNCAAALVLILRHFAAASPRNQVVISRGELVQIGGGFRIPEILQASNAILREVGTTNKTTPDDYRLAINPETALVLKVHHSNFYMAGFVESPSTQELATIAHQAGVPLVEDLGSGASFDTTALGGGEREPTPSQSLAAGADLVCFSGDKLLGGPQAGIIAGSAAYVKQLKANPFFRALRCDKLILAALQTTIDLLLAEQFTEIPIRTMMQTPITELRSRAERIVAALSDLPAIVQVGEGSAKVGGGSLPRTILPSVTVDLQSPHPSPPLQRFLSLLRKGQPPVVGYIESDRLKLDLRTVFPAQDESLIRAIRACVPAGGS